MQKRITFVFASSYKYPVEEDFFKISVAATIFPVFSGEAALPERFFVWPAELLEPAKFLF